MTLPKSAGLKLAALTSLFLVFSLLFREFLGFVLLERGFSRGVASTAAKCAGIVLLAAMTWPLLARFRLSLAGFFRRPSSVPVTFCLGVGGGLLFRLLDWSFLLYDGFVAGRRVSVGLSCARPAFDAVAISGIALPLAEEIAHRGLLLTGLVPLGIAPAILGSALVFAVLHTNLVAPFLFGVFAASIALRSGALWIPVIAHSTFNLLRAFEAACVRVLAGTDAGMLMDPRIAVVVAIAMILLLLATIGYAGTGTRGRTGAGVTGR